jgi:hypothetical protein
LTPLPLSVSYGDCMPQQMQDMPRNTAITPERDDTERLLRRRNECLNALGDLARKVDAKKADDILAEFWVFERSIARAETESRSLSPKIQARKAIATILEREDKPMTRDKIAEIGEADGFPAAGTNSGKTRILKALGYYLDNPQGKALQVLQEDHGLVGLYGWTKSRFKK